MLEIFPTQEKFLEIFPTLEEASYVRMAQNYIIVLPDQSIYVRILDHVYVVRLRICSRCSYMNKANAYVGVEPGKIEERPVYT